MAVIGGDGKSQGAGRTVGRGSHAELRQHDRAHTALSFPTLSLSSLVRGEKPALAFTETTDTLGLLCWLFKDELLAKINAGLDEVADDKAALSQQEREEMEATISSIATDRAQ
jgi:hypothetical protein